MTSQTGIQTWLPNPELVQHVWMGFFFLLAFGILMVLITKIPAGPGDPDVEERLGELERMTTMLHRSLAEIEAWRKELEGASNDPSRSRVESGVDSAPPGEEEPGD